MQFDVRLKADDLGIAGLGGGEALSGISGELVADQAGGRLELGSDDLSLRLPKVFADTLDVERLDGLLVWRVTADGIRILSDDVGVKTSFAEASCRFELAIPSSGESPHLDLVAQANADEAVPVVDFLPLRRFPPKVVGWLRRAITAGRATDAEFEIRGPLGKFPFDESEGVFRIAIEIEDGILDYAAGWPPVEDLDGELVFDGLGLYTRRNKANYGGIPVSNIDVSIADLRKGMLVIRGPQKATADQALGFLKASPIADAVGPILQRVSADGQLDVGVDLRLPVTRPQEYALRLDVETDEARLDLERLDFSLTKIAGSLKVRNTKFQADELTAELLGEPVSVSMRPALMAVMALSLSLRSVSGTLRL